VHGALPAAQFIAIAEERGMIGQLGKWVLLEACRFAVRTELPWLAVNVSPLQLRDAGFADGVASILAEAGLAPERLQLEITENVLLENSDAARTTLANLRRSGVGIVLDDFGTGYSSLGYLQKFHFDKLKIDRSFVSALQTDTQAAAIVRAVVRMSHAMGIRVLAEGVEHAEQASALHDEGCEEAQGFLFGRALPATQFRDLLAQSTLRLPQHEPAPA